MTLYLAIDAGGTKTTAVLADEHQVLARASAGSIKTMRVLPEDATHSLQALLQSLEAQAGLPIFTGRRGSGSVARTCIGAAGLSVPAVRAWLQGAVDEAVGGELLLLGDETIALDAAFRGGRGVLAIAGTGSNIVGRAAGGAMVHTSGWGPALSDEGSGHWIGGEALRACFRAIDAAAPSSADAVASDGVAPVVRPEHLPPLLLRLMQALELATLGEVIGAANSPAFVSAALVPVVAGAAEAGDPIALEVLRRAGCELAAQVAGVIRKISLLEAESRAALPPPEVAFVGSILAHVGLVREAMHVALRKRYPGIVLQSSPVDPLEGALWHARGRH